MAYIAKPWVKVAARGLVVLLIFFVALAIVLSVLGLSTRVMELEKRPITIQTIVATPIPTATPSATLAPVRRVTQPVMPSATPSL